MENNEIKEPQTARMTQEEMLREIYENTKKTKNYMKWQLYITLVLVVLPLLAAVFLVPYTLSSLGSAYSAAGLLQ